MASRFIKGRELYGIDKYSGTFVPRGKIFPCVVFIDPVIEVNSGAGIEPAGRLTLQHVRVIPRKTTLVGGNWWS